MKKILSLAGLVALPLLMQAQDFSFENDTLVTLTSGNNDSYVGATNFIVNESSESIVYYWRFLNRDVELPDGWAFDGICDNKLCYIMESIPNPFSGDTIESMPVAFKDESVFEVRMLIPTSAAEGSIFLEFEVYTENQIDSVYFIISKTPAGIQTIPVHDLRVNIYPNPSHNNTIHVVTKSELNIEYLYFYNSLGQKVLEMPTQGKELTSIDISSFTSGNYFMEAINTNNERVVSKQFIKQ